MPVSPWPKLGYQVRAGKGHILAEHAMTGIKWHLSQCLAAKGMEVVAGSNGHSRRDRGYNTPTAYT